MNKLKNIKKEAEKISQVFKDIIKDMYAYYTDNLMNIVNYLSYEMKL